MQDVDMNLVGERIAMKVLVALALSLATRDKEDARDALAEVLRGVSGNIDQSLAEISIAVSEDDARAISESAADTVRSVGDIANHLLGAIGR